MAQYQLYLRDELLGTLTEDALDFPWVTGLFDATPAFDRVKATFEEERRLLTEGKLKEWGAIWARLIEAGLRIEPTDADEEPIQEFLVHIDGQRFTMKSVQ